MTTIQRVGQGSAAVTNSGSPFFNTTSITYTLDPSTNPTTPFFQATGGIGQAAIGDWIVLTLNTLSTDTIGTPAGFTIIANQTVGSYRFYIAVREVLTSGDLTAHWTFTFSGVKIIAFALFDVYRGMTFLRTSGSATVNTAVTVSAPSVTATRASDELMTVLCSGTASTSTSFSNITPAQDTVFDNTNGGGNESQFIGVRTPGAGSTGTTSGDRSSAASQLGAHLLWATIPRTHWWVGSVH